MKLKHKHKTWIISGIAVLFLGYGLLDMVFDFNISPKLVNNVSFILMILAFGLFFSNRNFKRNNTNGTNVNGPTEDKALDLETGNNDNDNTTNDNDNNSNDVQETGQSRKQ